MKMTYVELCRLIESGEQPDKITVDGNEYVWDGWDYGRETCDLHADFSIEELVNKFDIIVKENPLTDKERKYLKAVINPFIDRVHSITKKVIGDREYILIDCSTEECGDEATLPYSAKGTTYKHMEENKEYTLEELGL